MYILVDNNLVKGFSTESGVYEVKKEDKHFFKFGDNIVNSVKELMLAEVRNKFQAQIDAITANYAPYELESFVDQRSEWKAWTADNTIATPIVDAIAAGRGVTKEELMLKIGANVISISTLQGQQNAVEDAIKACTTLEELKAIVI